MPKLDFGTKKRFADLPLHWGQVPPWLAQRMSLLGGAITEAIVVEYGRSAFMTRLSDPMWFQALGCVLGMDWHSSGITTSVMGALKKSVNPKFNELGIYICGGKGKYSRQTPDELLQLSNKTGLDGNELVRSSKLTAKVDNNAIQDGYQIYLHSFVVTKEGEWAVVQQGMNDSNGMARRYHWLSENLDSYVLSPHKFIYGKNQGTILNLTDDKAQGAHSSILEIARQDPFKMLPEIQKIVLPRHHDVRISDVNLKRLGAVLALAHEKQPSDFESLLLLEGVGPRTIQSLALVSEVIHGTPSRFTDPARFSFAHGGKDGYPFPVPTKVYDETINILQTAVDKSKLGYKDKSDAIRRLNQVCLKIEENFEPEPEAFDRVIEKEWKNSYTYGGRTAKGWVKPPKNQNQLSLFE